MRKKTAAGALRALLSRNTDKRDVAHHVLTRVECRAIAEAIRRLEKKKS